MNTISSGTAPKAKKSLGQNFLQDDNICRRIAALLDTTDADRIIEIGPGPGALTRFLQASPHSLLILLEKDTWWASDRQRVADCRTQTVLTDALAFDWRRISPQYPWIIAGNLPYNVASPLIWDITAQATGLVRAVFMVQKEVGLRLCAQPGTKQYGALSAWVQSHVSPTLEFIVRPGAFSPQPKVDSAVLSFTPLPVAQRPTEPDSLKRLLSLCFQQRRKQLGGIFRRAALPDWEDILRALRIEPTLRPEALSPVTFNKMAVSFRAALTNHKKKS